MARLRSQPMPGRDWSGDVERIRQAISGPWWPRVEQYDDHVLIYFQSSEAEETEASPTRPHETEAYHAFWADLPLLGGLQIAKVAGGREIQLSSPLSSGVDLVRLFDIISAETEGIRRLLVEWPAQEVEGTSETSSYLKASEEVELSVYAGWVNPKSKRYPYASPGYVKIMARHPRDAVYRRDLFLRFLAVAGGEGQGRAELVGGRLKVVSTGDWTILPQLEGAIGPGGIDVYGFTSVEALQEAIAALLDRFVQTGDAPEVLMDLTRPVYESLRPELSRLNGGAPWEVAMSLGLSAESRRAVRGLAECLDRPARIPLLAWTESPPDPDETIVEFHMDLVTPPTGPGLQLELSCDVEDGLEILRERAAVLPDLEFTPV